MPGMSRVSIGFGGFRRGGPAGGCWPNSIVSQTANLFSCCGAKTAGAGAPVPRRDQGRPVAGQNPQDARRQDAAVRLPHRARLRSAFNIHKFPVGSEQMHAAAWCPEALGVAGQMLQTEKLHLEHRIMCKLSPQDACCASKTVSCLVMSAHLPVSVMKQRIASLACRRRGRCRRAPSRGCTWPATSQSRSTWRPWRVPSSPASSPRRRLSR